MLYTLTGTYNTILLIYGKRKTLHEFNHYIKNSTGFIPDLSDINANMSRARRLLRANDIVLGVQQVIRTIHG